MKKVLITGGTKGLGKSLVLKYLNNNYEVYATYHNDTYEKIPNVNYLKLDLENKNSIDELVDNLNEIDVLINNAGISDDDDIKNKTYESMQKVLSTNLLGPLYLSKRIATEKMNKGTIIFITSDCAFDNNYPEGIDYDASKSGLTKVIDDLAIYLAPNIRVIGVAPGWINTTMNKDIDDNYKKEQIKNILLNRFAEPDEISNVVYFLTSDEASYINKTTIIVNGGTK